MQRTNKYRPRISFPSPLPPPFLKILSIIINKQQQDEDNEDEDEDEEED